MSAFPLESGRTFQRAEGLLTAAVGDEMLMMNVSQGTYIHLSRVGKRIWELLETPTTSDALVDRLAEEYEVTEMTLRAEVTAFLARLEEEALLRRPVDSASD